MPVETTRIDAGAERTGPAHGDGGAIGARTGTGAESLPCGGVPRGDDLVSLPAAPPQVLVTGEGGKPATRRAARNQPFRCRPRRGVVDVAGRSMQAVVVDDGFTAKHNYRLSGLQDANRRVQLARLHAVYVEFPVDRPGSEILTKSRGARSSGQSFRVRPGAAAEQGAGLQGFPGDAAPAAGGDARASRAGPGRPSPALGPAAPGGGERWRPPAAAPFRHGRGHRPRCGRCLGNRLSRPSRPGDRRPTSRICCRKR